MDLILHIGTAKTGTTTLQTWFATHRALLAERGIGYPASLGEISHVKLMTYARDSRGFGHSFIRWGIRDAAGHAAFRDRLRQDFHAELGFGPAVATWVISNEHLHYMLTNTRMVARVWDFVQPYFDSVRVVVHLRPQADLMVSVASQRARLGQRVDRALFESDAFGPANPYFDYDGLVARWEQVFGADRVHVLPFRRQPCMTTHLLGMLGLDRSTMPPILRLNESLDWRVMALANLIDRPLLDRDRRLNPDREMFIEALPGAERLVIGPALAAEITERFRAGNERLAARRDDIGPEDLLPDPATHAGAPNIDRLGEVPPYRPQLNAMVAAFNRSLRRERCLRHLAEAALALRDGDDGALALALAAVEECLPGLEADEAIRAARARLAEGTALAPNRPRPASDLQAAG